MEEEKKSSVSFSDIHPTQEGGQKILIISSHPAGTQSFCSALIQVAKETLEAAGNVVFVDDLVERNFNPTPGRHDFIGAFNINRLDLQDEQKHAARGGGAFAQDLKEQMDMLVWCDVVIHVFPLHWWSLPALHKGWMDRVLAYHWCYGSGAGEIRPEETPPNKRLAGKKWMLAVSSGGPAFVYNKSGNVHPEAPSIDKMLWSFTQGTPNFCGFEALPLFSVGGARNLGDDGRAAMLRDFANHMRRYVLRQEGVAPPTYAQKPLSVAYEYVTDASGKSLSKQN